MAHRPFAVATVSRLLRVLFDPAHTFVLHLDARANASTAEQLRDRFAGRANVHVLKDRRRVGWGAYSMVEVLRSALASALASKRSWDFFINLSDADIALRTGSELTVFLSRFLGRSFVAIKFPQADAVRYRAHAHTRRFAWLECEGEGFLVLNQSAEGFFGSEPRLGSLARSGPILFEPGPLPITRPPPPEDWEAFHGSQWLILARPHAEWLIHDPDAARLARHMQLTYMADESYVQTALGNSPYRSELINHNLRFLEWPHGYGDPSVYWRTVGPQHAAGPMLLTPSLFARVTSSAAVFARKVELGSRPGRDFLGQWDGWMAAKMGGAVASGSDGLAAPAEQPSIAAPLLAEDPTLRAARPPPTAAERVGLNEDELRAKFPPRSVHFGHEDVMGSEPRARAQPSASSGVLAAGGRRLGLARIIFTDGSSCSCAPRACGAEALSGAECCDAWRESACAAPDPAGRGLTPAARAVKMPNSKSKRLK